MIIWLASYPKSGNTWVRSLLSTYLYSKDSQFNFNLLNKIKQFPNKMFFESFTNNFQDIKIISNFWIAAQTKINLAEEIVFLKTHSALCTVENNPFTNKLNTKAAIYIVRDPRNVITSLSHHYSLNIEESLDFITDKSRILYPEEGFGIATFLGNWAENYKSWKNFSSVKKIIIKYEDLILSPYETFFKIINYLNKINDLPIDEKMIKKSIDNTSFKNLQNLEKKFGFKESTHGIFFRKGKIGNWKNELDIKISSQMEQVFKEEMKELGYL